MKLRRRLYVWNANITSHEQYELLPDTEVEKELSFKAEGLYCIRVAEINNICIYEDGSTIFVTPCDKTHADISRVEQYIKNRLNERNKSA